MKTMKRILVKEKKKKITLETDRGRGGGVVLVVLKLPDRVCHPIPTPTKTESGSSLKKGPNLAKTGTMFPHSKKGNGQRRWLPTYLYDHHNESDMPHFRIILKNSRRVQEKWKLKVL